MNLFNADSNNEASVGNKSMKMLFILFLFVFVSCGDLILTSNSSYSNPVLECHEYNDRIELSWMPLENVENHTILRGVSSDQEEIMELFPELAENEILFSNADDLDNNSLEADSNGVFSYIDADCKSDMVYWYKLTVEQKDGNLLESNIVFGKLVAFVPVFRGERLADNSVKLYWDRIDNAVSYVLSADNNKIAVYLQDSSNLTNTMAAGAGDMNSITYVFHDKSYLVTGESAYCLEVATDYSRFNASVSVKRDPALFFQASKNSDNTVNISWKAVETADNYTLLELFGAGEEGTETGEGAEISENENALSEENISYSNFDEFFSLPSDSSLLPTDTSGAYKKIEYRINKQFTAGEHRFAIIVFGEEDKNVVEQSIVQLEYGYGLHSVSGSLDGSILTLSWEDVSTYSCAYSIDRKRSIYSISSEGGSSLVEEGEYWGSISYITEIVNKTVKDSPDLSPSGLSYKYTYRINAFDCDGDVISTVYYEIQI